MSLCGLLMLITSCVSTRNSVYFVDQQDATLLSSISVPQTIISSNDLLSITVSSLNPAASSVFNAPNVTYATNTPTNGGGPVQASGYLVDVDGNIQFPILGNIRAAGLTENALRVQIVKSLIDKKLLIDPVITIRHLNFRVTVLGEVGNPTVISVPNEKITLLEALGLAGDVTIYGKRDNIMVIREENNKKIIKRLNLNTSEIFESPYYYLRSNDIVYVEPNKAKVSGSSRTTQLLPIILSGLSLAAIILDRVIR
ncbi:MAG: Soluble ligand binding domain protein [Flavisolibacter sp.]|nr:Soluble ligand binding domain protein [Flavisolibacter sp.]